MKRAYFIVIVAVVLGLSLAVLAGPSVMANDNDREGPKVFDRDSVVYGRTSGEWAAEWWQWALSIPTAIHPLFDKGDCSVGQSGPVWFLGGSFVSNTAVRSCTIPAGTYLYFPILNGEDSSLEESNGDGCSNPTFGGDTIVGVRKCAESYENGVTVTAEIDGVPIRNIAAKYRVQSPAYGFTLPDDNVFKATTLPSHVYPKGTYFPSVNDGYYLMLTPLREGTHVIHFHGVGGGGSFTLDITYNLNVAK
jgi:hypothetical protein